MALDEHPASSTSTRQAERMVMTPLGLSLLGGRLFVRELENLHPQIFRQLVEGVRVDRAPV